MDKNDGSHKIYEDSKDVSDNDSQDGNKNEDTKMSRV